MSQICHHLLSHLYYLGALLFEFCSFDQTSLSFNDLSFLNATLGGLVKHTLILVTYIYDTVFCKVFHKHFLMLVDRLILVSVFLFCFTLDILEVKTHAL